MSIIKEHIEYLKDNPQRYWFKRKLYGWGWTPATKEGWGVTFLYIILVFLFAFTIDESSPAKEVMFTFILPFVFLTLAFIRIAYKKGEKAKWMWGPDKKDNQEKE